MKKLFLGFIIVLFFVIFSTNIAIAATPTITSISPLSGKVGDTITINGNNFIGIDKVLFGSVDVGLNLKVVSSTQITAVVPYGAVNGPITVKTQNFGNIVSSDIFKVNLVPKDNIQLTAKNITQNSVTLSAYGIILQNSYDFYVYDSAVYYKPPLSVSDAVAHKVLDLQNPTNPIEINIDGLSPGHKYVGVVDYNSNVNPDIIYPFVEFSTLQDLTAGLESITTSKITETSVDIVATGLSDGNTYQIQLLNDSNKSPTPTYDKTIDITAVNGTATASFTDLTANNNYIAGIIKNNNTASLMSRITFTTNSTSNPNINTNTNDTPNSTPFGGLVPSCGQVVTKTDPTTGKSTSTMAVSCDFNFFMQLINNIIKFLLFTIATPLVALIIMYTGYLYITAGGNAGQTEKAKHIMFNVVIGFIIALAAWLIVNTIVSSFNLDPTINTFLQK